MKMLNGNNDISLECKKTRINDHISEDEYLSPESLAKLLDVSVAWLKRNRHSKKPIPYMKLGRLIRYKRTDVFTWLNKTNKH